MFIVKGLTSQIFRGKWTNEPEHGIHVYLIHDELLMYIYLYVVAVWVAQQICTKVKMPKWYSEAVHGRRTYNTMTKWKSSKGQIVIYKASHRKL